MKASCEITPGPLRGAQSFTANIGQGGRLIEKNSHDQRDRTMILLDFDGVLMDSVAEVAVSAYNACTRRLVTTVEGLPGGLLNSFKRRRHLMQTPSEAIPLMSWCLEKNGALPGGDPGREGFARLCRSSPLSAEIRRRRFYRARQQLCDQSPGDFVRLNRPFQPLWDWLVKNQAVPFVLLTAKNRRAVLTLCRHFGLGIDAGDVYPGDGGVSKRANMEAIDRRFGAPGYLFIDDLLPNLMEVKAGFSGRKAALRLLLADWGYGPAEDAAAAAGEGIGVINQRAAIDILESACRS